MLLKLAHIADPHLGYHAYTRQYRNMNARDYDIKRAFYWCMMDAAEWGCDLLIVAGDLFHSPRPTVHTIHTAIVTLRRFFELRPNAVVLLVGGNHDTPRTADVMHPLELFRNLNRNIRIAIGEPYSEIVTIRGMKVQLAAIPTSRPDRYRYAEGAKPAVQPDPAADIHVLTLHGVHPQVLPHYSFNEQWLIQPEFYRHDAWAYIAWGDYHDMTRLGEREYYAGSPEHCSTNPWHERPERGYLRVLLTDGHRIHVSLQRYPQARPHITVRGTDPEEISRQLESIEEPEHAVVRVILSWTGSYQQGSQHLAELRKRYSDLFFHLQVHLQRQRVQPAREAQVSDRVLSIEERWRQFVQSMRSQLPDGMDTEDIIRRGLEAMQHAVQSNGIKNGGGGGQ